jgi:hypothetical protein
MFAAALEAMLLNERPKRAGDARRGSAIGSLGEG